MTLPRAMAWLFPDYDPAELDPEHDRRLILARVLEHGRLSDVRWCVRRYGFSGIHQFLRAQAHPELSPKTLALWRAVLNAKHEAWPQSRRSRLRSAAPWPG